MGTSEFNAEGEIDSEIATRLARDRLADRLQPPAETEQSDIAQLIECTSEITRALENGEVPEPTKIGTARFYLKELEERLDEVTKLYGWNPWDTGANWGELTEEEQAEIEERDERRICRSEKSQEFDSDET